MQSVATLFMHMSQYKPFYGRYPLNLVLGAVALIFLAWLPYSVWRSRRDDTAPARGRRLGLFFGGLAVLYVFWSLAFPLYQTPDEQSHFLYVYTLGEFRRLPLIKLGDRQGELPVIPEEYDRSLEFHRIIFNRGLKHPFSDGKDGLNEARYTFTPAQRRARRIPFTQDQWWKVQTNHYPPLYYALAAVPYEIFHSGSFFTRYWAARLASILLSLLSVFVMLKTAEALLPEGRRHLAYAAAALFAVFPMYSQVSIAVNPNILEILVCELFVLLCIRLREVPLTAGGAALLALCAGAGLATKQHLGLLTPLGAAFLIARLIASRAPLSRWAVTGSVFALVAGVTGGWWYLWFYHTHGHVDMITLHNSSNYAAVLTRPRFDLWAYVFSGTVFRFPLTGLLGSFAWRNLTISPVLVWVLTAAAAAGAALYAWKLRLLKRADPRLFLRHLMPAGFVLFILAVIKYVGFSSFSVIGWDILQGRHFYAALGGMIFIVFYGLSVWNDEALSRRAGAALVAGMCLYNAWALFYLIIPRFY